MPRYQIGGNGKPVEVTERFQIGEGRKVYEVLERYFIDPVTKTAKIVWESIKSSFLDRFGNPFCDKDGVPFQGKPE